MLFITLTYARLNKGPLKCEMYRSLTKGDTLEVNIGAEQITPIIIYFLFPFDLIPQHI